MSFFNHGGITMKTDNKVIVITGCSSGIGRALAVALSQYNNKIVIVARRKNLLDKVASLIRKNGSQCLSFAGNALDEHFCKMVVEEAVRQFGPIQIGILNIGVGPPSNTLTAPAETIKHCMRVNFDTFINFYVPLMAQMKRQEEPCMIAHMNSLASFFGIPMQGDYTASKGAVRLFMQTARMELKHFGIRHIKLQTIHPGFVNTEAVRNDGIPAPGEISEVVAAKNIIKGIQREKKENMFPITTSIGVRLARRCLPEWLITHIVLRETPKEY